MSAANTALYSTGGANGGLAPPASGLTLNTNFTGSGSLTVNGGLAGSLSAGPALAGPGGAAQNGQGSPSFPPSPNLNGETPLGGPYSAMANLQTYGMGFNGLMGMNFPAFGAMNSPSVYAMSPTVGGFGNQQNAVMGAGVR